MTKEHPRTIVPAGMESAGPVYGFAPARISGGFLFISGQLGFNADGSLHATQKEQARLALDAIGRILTEAGCDFGDVVELTTLHVGDCTSVNEWFLPLKKDIFPAPFPAWTSMGVTSLAIPGALIEIKALAKLPL